MRTSMKPMATHITTWVASTRAGLDAAPRSPGSCSSAPLGEEQVAERPGPATAPSWEP